MFTVTLIPHCVMNAVLVSRYSKYVSQKGIISIGLKITKIWFLEIFSSIITRASWIRVRRGVERRMRKVEGMGWRRDGEVDGSDVMAIGKKEGGKKDIVLSFSIYNLYLDWNGRPFLRHLFFSLGNSDFLEPIQSFKKFYCLQKNRYALIFSRWLWKDLKGCECTYRLKQVCFF